MATQKKAIRYSPKRLTITVRKEAPSLSSYVQDFYRWTKDQVDLLKKGDYKKLDINHLIEEIESLGNSEQRALESYLVVLLMHLLKIKYQPTMHTKSWDNSVKNALFRVEKLLKKNPSLKAYLPEIFNDAYYIARLDAASETGLDDKIFPAKCPWTPKELFPSVLKGVKYRPCERTTF